eukprot:CAMPEP_0115144446 /NCGR_PEP_ID=MMETSP0227-20121206/61505_1 /TAXON_ID=89957 /ORGANISM="Polarella glacialis, Strain CCMP 1383" /LENGTH=45 /DNA_ID= /DNA_START= /DNA_END= /DNA_ORIENTATION=
MAPLVQLSLDTFAAWRAGVPESEVLHVKGFGCNVGSYYDADALDA